ncbi:MAG: hypothetical protein ABIJ18_03340 [archaeon]
MRKVLYSLFLVLTFIFLGILFFFFTLYNTTANIISGVVIASARDTFFSTMGFLTLTSIFYGFYISSDKNSSDKKLSEHDRKLLNKLLWFSTVFYIVSIMFYFARDIAYPKIFIIIQVLLFLAGIMLTLTLAYRWYRDNS